MTEEASISDPQGDRNKWMILSAVMLGVIMGPIDGSIVNVVLPTIANYFQTDYALVQWVPTIYPGLRQVGGHVRLQTDFSHRADLLCRCIPAVRVGP